MDRMIAVVHGAAVVVIAAVQEEAMQLHAPCRSICMVCGAGPLPLSHFPLPLSFSLFALK
jgi:hypothetical protein